MTLTRRSFLTSSLACFSTAFTLGAFPGQARAAGNSTKVLFVNLNGGLDGLAALQPSAGSLYSTLSSIRPTLALSPGSLLNANGLYGFHPALTTFKALYDEGALTTVLNVGYANMTRSHLDAETAFARGVADRLAPTPGGFLNRVGSYYGWNSLKAVSVSGSDLTFEGGAYRGLQVNSLSSLYFRSFSTTSEIRDLTGRAFEINSVNSNESSKSYQKNTAENFGVAVNTTDVVKTAAQTIVPTYTYPNNQFGRALKDIHVLFASSEIDTQIGYMRPSGFDTHGTQGDRLNTLLGQFNAAFGVFVQNMKALNLWDNLIVVVYSEFGRTNAENGSQGTDHGAANPVFLTGGVVNSSQIIGTQNPSDLTGSGWLKMEHNVVEIYRRVLMRLDLDPDAVFSPSQGPNLSGLFV